MKYILCKCGKRYREDNKKHFESKEHKKYIEETKVNESNEIHIIVNDIDKNELMEFLRSKSGNKRRYAISDDEIEDLTDKDFKPDESSSSSDSSDSEEEDDAEEED